MSAETPQAGPVHDSVRKGDGPPAAAPAGAAGATSAHRRRWLFRIFFLTLPVILLGGGEVAARLSGRGGYPPVIEHVGSDGVHDWYTTLRPGVDSFFYTKLSHTGGMRTVNFVEPKPANTVRILFLGGSAMQGYPYELPLTNGAILEAMLNDAWGGARRAEVLNLGATAMASFPARCFLNEMIGHDLDLVVIMTGNNAFYGAYGVSSLHSAGTTPTGMRMARWLRGLGLVQWLADVFMRSPSAASVANQPLMQRVAVNQHVGPADRLRTRARSCLEADLRDMVDLCQERGVPVITCTVPVNERDIAPIGEDELPAGDAAKTYAEALAAAEAAGDAAAAEALLTRAIALNPTAARPHYLLGRACLQLGDDARALGEFTQARDLDTMPWRACSWTNDVVRATAGRGARVCDMEGFMRRQSPHGAIGWELMCDHVHMTARGQALFAECIARELTGMEGVLHVDAEALAALPGWEHYVNAYGTEFYDEYVMATRVRTLFQIPFMQRNNADALALWSRRCDELTAQMSPRDREAAVQWEDPGLHVSNHRPLSFVVGYYRMQDGDFAVAERLFNHARACMARVSLWRLQLSWYTLKCRRSQRLLSAEDDALCAEGIETGLLLNRFVGFLNGFDPSYLGMIYSVCGHPNEAVTILDQSIRYASGQDGWDAVRILAEALVQEGQVAQARKLLTLAKNDENLSAAAQRLLDQLDRLYPPSDASAP